jgi:predicted metal-binding membrane protein
VREELTLVRIELLLGAVLLLFAGGVMNVVVIAGLTAWVALEKLAPFSRRAARFSGAVMIAVGSWILMR